MAISTNWSLISDINIIIIISYCIIFSNETNNDENRVIVII